ncbi:MAG: YggS family pyridoxal phosphate-dependent enzyme [Oscillospiraceae bacterium]|jgi:pyridoxal phosphate enzyme (YggS family)|nr:YggS family pyridoxal phosphate-dependent enzyme [Oscillospiraceae bacterium]
MSIAENLAQVKARVAAAAKACGRDENDILLIGATKMNDAQRVREAVAAGLPACGENRVQELRDKNALGAYEGSELHFIGTLQKNKVKYLVGVVKLIHSVDSVELMQAIDKQAQKLGIIQDILIEINTGGESTKSGLAPEELSNALYEASKLPGIRVRGLMTIPPICVDGTENIPFFQLLKQLFVDNSEKKYDNVYMDFMSMGMSGDFETAIACGSNMIRVGTAIFGQRAYPAK